MVKIKEIINRQQQAIEFLKTYDYNCPMIEETNFIIKALEKQIPKKPTVLNLSEVAQPLKKCPNCGYIVSKYCPECGQKIDLD